MRLRENKRRHRARQREYTTDLEQRLRQLEHEGVRATIEVQSAAKKVAEENKHLRDLLSALGVDKQTINEWVTRRACASDNKGGCQNQSHKSWTSGNHVRPVMGLGRCSTDANKDEDSPSTGTLSSKPLCSKSCNDGHQEDGFELDNTIKPADESPTATGNIPVPNRCSPSSVGKQRLCNMSENRDLEGPLRRELGDPGEVSSQQPSAPCRLLTRLAANPTSDISHIFAASHTESTAGNAEGGVTCESAYKLLMRYATSEEKLNALAHALEDGCVPSSDGGCKVKNEKISEALLDICL